MVCMGNICRSPLAESYFKSLTAKAYPSVQIYSAGTHDYHDGSPADPRAIMLAKENNIDITNHKARYINKINLLMFDYIFSMDLNNLLFLSAHFIALKHRQYLLTSFSNKLEVVPDPYYGDINAFNQSFKVIKAGCRSLYEQLFILNK